MRKKTVLCLLIMTGMTILFTPFPQIGRAAIPSQLKCPSCDSFGVQRFQERKEAPAFSLQSLDRKQVSLSDFRGRPVLITFWATWCASCKEDIPSLEKLSARKKNQLTILLITIDGERKPLKGSRTKIRLPFLSSCS
jgi:thiol-disulfide isomerase/thioredoxin